MHPVYIHACTLAGTHMHMRAYVHAYSFNDIMVLDPSIHFHYVDVTSVPLFMPPLLSLSLSPLSLSPLLFSLPSQPVSNADFVVPVEIDGVVHQVYVLKRPHCDEFLKRMGEMFECVLFTASLAKVS